MYYPQLAGIDPLFKNISRLQLEHISDLKEKIKLKKKNGYW